MKRLKIMTIFGTRPEIIRLSRVFPVMDQYFDHVMVCTQQSYDYELNEIFFQDLGLRKPDYLLSVKSETLGGQIAHIITQTEAAMEKENPDAVLLLGDTNSALSAIIAKRRGIMIFHMEAGNRSFDEHVPEELNRKIVDHISDINLPYTEHSRRYLIQEGIRPEKIFVTGSPLREVIEYYQDKIKMSSIIDNLTLEKGKYFLVSAHREENVDNEKNLHALFESLNAVASQYSFPVVISLHPRTKLRLEKIKMQYSPLLQFAKPFGYFDYCTLQQHALCVLSDSGTIQEESAILSFSAIQIRVSTERPEAFDAGSIILTGFQSDTILQAIYMTLEEKKCGVMPSVIEDYQDINVSTKVAKLILGHASIRCYHGS